MYVNMEQSEHVKRKDMQNVRNAVDTGDQWNQAEDIQKNTRFDDIEEGMKCLATGLKHMTRKSQWQPANPASPKKNPLKLASCLINSWALLAHP